MILDEIVQPAQHKPALITAAVALISVLGCCLLVYLPDDLERGVVGARTAEAVSRAGAIITPSIVAR